MTYTLTPTPKGTCVVGDPAVQRMTSITSGGRVSLGLGIGGGRRMGSFTNLDKVLAKLGGSILPKDQAMCRSGM